jgi:hypothetical protein
MNDFRPVDLTASLEAADGVFAPFTNVYKTASKKTRFSKVRLAPVPQG